MCRRERDLSEKTPFQSLLQLPPSFPFHSGIENPSFQIYFLPLERKEKKGGRKERGGEEPNALLACFCCMMSPHSRFIGEEIRFYFSPGEGGRKGLSQRSLSGTIRKKNCELFAFHYAATSLHLVVQYE